MILDSFGDFGLLVRACKLYKERQRGKTEKSLRQALEAKLYLASPPAGAVAVSSVSVAVAACDMPAILHLYSGQVARPWLGKLYLLTHSPHLPPPPKIFDVI